jgi:hypothetical protein
VPANGAAGKVRTADRDRSGSLQALNDGSISTGICVGQCFEPLRGRRAGDVDVLLHGERHAVERPEVSAVGDRTISRVGRFQRLLGHDNDNGVDRAIDCLNALKVRLNDFLTGNLSGSDRFGQLRGAHTPQFRGRCDAHVRLPYPRPCHRRGCFSADIKTPSKWTPVVAPEGSRLKTTLAVFRPYLERSMRKMYGSCLSSGCS